MGLAATMPMPQQSGGDTTLFNWSGQQPGLITGGQPANPLRLTGIGDNRLTMGNIEAQGLALESERMKQQLLSQLLGGGGIFGRFGMSGGNNNLFNQNMADIARMGGSARNQINRDFNTQLNNSLAGLESRGFGGSTLRPSVEFAAQQGRQQSLLGLEDQLLGARVGARDAQMDRGVESIKALSGLLGGLF